MPEGGNRTSLSSMVSAMMAPFHRQSLPPGAQPLPQGKGAPIASYSWSNQAQPGGPGNTPDLSQFAPTFRPSGGLFAPGYPLVPVEREQLRGPQHDCAWCDELAAWRYPEAWDMLMFGMRLGAEPRTEVTTTPRPAKLIGDLVRDPICVVTRGSSYENRGNLAPAFFDQIIRKYQGTRLGRQELEAELLEDTPGALWSHGSIEASRLRSAPEMTRVVVAIDPAVTSGEEADETGIVVAGKDKNGHGYVLADISGRYPLTEWARLAITAYTTHRADRIVAEVNNGGDMVGATLRMVDPNVAFTAVRASRGKVVRAEPVAALYQQGRVHHIGTFPQLEDHQMTNFTSDIDRAAAGYSPDRVDALVWAFSKLLVEPMKGGNIFELARRYAEAAEQRDKPQPTQTTWAIGSMEWQAEQEKSR
jgi:predicted phage terminase large subunit-like protein